MSTKAIRRALDYLEAITASGYFGPEALADFKAEVEAIERAAKKLVDEDGDAETNALLERIAEDAP